MKIKNIVFSGVMGAILATAANAAPTIASKAYVDGLIDNNVTNLSQTIATHTTDIATNASGVAVNKAAIDAINNADTGLLSQAKAYTDELADGAVATNTGNITTLMANAETTGSVDNKVATSAAQTKTAYETYAIPKPDSNQCNAASGLCVLSYNSQGVLQWVDVTEEGTATPDESTTGGQEA